MYVVVNNPENLEKFNNNFREWKLGCIILR